MLLEMPVLPGIVAGRGSTRPAAGFGLTVDDVVGSGTGELVERYAASIVPDPLPRASARTPLESWIPFSDRQYAEPGFPFADPRTLPDLQWTVAWDVARRTPVEVPRDLVYLTVSDGPEWCTMTSNGLAAGRTAGAAARSAVLELVERDAFFRAWYAGRSHPTLALDRLVAAGETAGLDPALVRHGRRILDAGVSVTLVRLPSATSAVSVIVACARSETVGLAIGCGARGDVRDALRSALIEAAHTYSWALDLMAEPDREIDDPITAHVAHHARPGGGGSNAFLDAGAGVDVNSFLASSPRPLSGILGSLGDAGWDVYLADVAPSDVRRNGWHVIRALSPSAATLDVGPIHEAQHPVIHHREPHPFP